MNVNGFYERYIDSFSRQYQVAIVSVLLLLCTVFSYVYIALPQLEKMNRLLLQTLPLEKEFKNATLLAKELEPEKVRLAQAIVVLNALRQQSPEKEDLAQLLNEINLIAETHGVHFNSLHFGRATQPSPTYIEVPLNIQVVGSYAKLGAFVAGIGALPRLVVLDDLRLSKGAHAKLILNVTLKTYRYHGH